MLKGKKKPKQMFSRPNKCMLPYRAQGSLSGLNSSVYFSIKIYESHTGLHSYQLLGIWEMLAQHMTQCSLTTLFNTLNEGVPFGRAHEPRRRIEAAHQSVACSTCSISIS